MKQSLEGDELRGWINVSLVESRLCGSGFTNRRRERIFVGELDAYQCSAKCAVLPHRKQPFLAAKFIFCVGNGDLSETKGKRRFERRDGVKGCRESQRSCSGAVWRDNDRVRRVKCKKSAHLAVLPFLLLTTSDSTPAPLARSWLLCGDVWRRNERIPFLAGRASDFFPARSSRYPGSGSRSAYREIVIVRLLGIK